MQIPKVIAEGKKKNRIPDKSRNRRYLNAKPPDDCALKEKKKKKNERLLKVVKSAHGVVGELDLTAAVFSNIEWFIYTPQLHLISGVYDGEQQSCMCESVEISLVDDDDEDEEGSGGIGCCVVVSLFCWSRRRRRRRRDQKVESVAGKNLRLRWLLSFRGTSEISLLDVVVTKKTNARNIA